MKIKKKTFGVKRRPKGDQNSKKVSKETKSKEDPTSYTELSFMQLHGLFFRILQ